MKKKTMLTTLVMLSLLQGTAVAEDWEADPYGEANISIQSSTFSSEYDNAIINYESNGTFNHWSAFAVLVTGEDSLLKINKVLDATITVTGEMDGYNQTTDKALAGICVKSSGVITVGEKTIVKVVDECDDDNTGEHYKVGVSVEQFDDPDPTFTMGTGESSVTVITNDEGRGFNLYGGKVTGGVLKIDVDTTSGDGVAYGIYAKRSGGNQAEEGSSMNFTDAITMNVKADSNAYGINGELKDKFTFKANKGFDITVTSNSNNAYGMNLVGEKEWGSAIAEAFEIGSGKVTVNGNSAAYGINLNGSFKDGIENKLGTIEFDVDANSGSAYGIQSYANGKLNVAGLSGEITSLTNKAYGVQVQDADSVNFGDSILTVTGAKDTVGFKLNGAFAEGAENDLGNLNLTVSSSGGKADGLAIAANGKYQVESLVAKVTGKNAVNGLSISNSDADVNITNGLNLTAQSTGTRTATALDNSNGTLTVNGAVILNATAADNTAYGISGGKTSTTIFNGAVGIDVAGATNSAAIKAEGSQLNFNNGLKANATNGYSSDVYALQADNATIEATEGDVLLNGNISAKNSANLTFAFNSSNGFTGATERSGESTINLDFKDSSRWDLMGDSALTTLAVAENAVVDMTADGGNYSKLTIDTLNDNGSNGTFKMEHKFLINLTKKEYIDMDAYISRSMTKDGWCVHPLPLMTSTGGDQGGGDYHEGYICQSYVGEWAYDEITIKDKAPKGKDFTLLNVTFSEEIEVVIEGVC